MTITDQEWEDQRKKYCSGIYCETSAELKKRIDKIINKKHDYNTSAEAIVQVAQLAKQYVYHKLGNTGFQAGWADLEELAVNRNYKHGFRVFDASQLLYPQYHLDEEYRKWKEESLKELKPVAQELLKKENLNHVHPDVLARWKLIAEQ